jgi:hypothetical protein
MRRNLDSPRRHEESTLIIVFRRQVIRSVQASRIGIEINPRATPPREGKLRLESRSRG